MNSCINIPEYYYILKLKDIIKGKDYVAEDIVNIYKQIKIETDLNPEECICNVM